MFKNTKDFILHEVFTRNTRGSERFVFKTDGYEGALYKHSPYFVGSKLWNELPSSIIDLPDINSFKSRLKGLNRKYVD